MMELHSPPVVDVPVVTTLPVVAVDPLHPVVVVVLEDSGSVVVVDEDDVTVPPQKPWL